MVLSGRGLLISIPALELGSLAPRGSVFDLEHLPKAGMTAELSSAVRVARQICAEPKMPLRFVARPEIFTHGASLDWLRGRLGEIRDHLCISDGTAIRPIPGLRNHLFLYRTGMRRNSAALERLTRCAPELLGRMDYQINSCLSALLGKRIIRPPSALLQSTSSEAATRVSIFRTIARRTAAADDRSRPPNRVAALGPPRRYARLTYVPVTETALDDHRFLTTVAGALSRCAADPSRCLIFRLPRIDTPAASARERCESALALVRTAFARRLPPMAPWLLFASDDVSARRLMSFAASAELLMHSSFEFWRHPQAYYSTFHSIRIVRGGRSASNRTALFSLLTSAFGRPPDELD
jgi:hypothetical protein